MHAPPRIQHSQPLQLQLQLLHIGSMHHFLARWPECCTLNPLLSPTAAAAHREGEREGESSIIVGKMANRERLNKGASFLFYHQRSSDVKREAEANPIILLLLLLLEQWDTERNGTEWNGFRPVNMFAHCCCCCCCCVHRRLRLDR